MSTHCISSLELPSSRAVAYVSSFPIHSPAANSDWPVLQDPPSILVKCSPWTTVPRLILLYFWVSVCVSSINDLRECDSLMLLDQGSPPLFRQKCFQCSSSSILIFFKLQYLLQLLYTTSKLLSQLCISMANKKKPESIPEVFSTDTYQHGGYLWVHWNMCARDYKRIRCWKANPQSFIVLVRENLFFFLICRNM